MGLSDDMANDLIDMINVDEFGVSAIFDSSISVIVIFDNPSTTVIDSDTGGIMMAGPQAICKSGDITNAKGKTLQIGGITYKILEAKDDGTGLTMLRLSKD